jgi:hypothetical protein
VAELLYDHGYLIWRNEAVEVAALRKSLKLTRLTGLNDLPASGADYYWLAVHRDSAPTARVSAAA